MDIYFAPVLFTVGAWLVQIRRNRRIDLAALILCALVITLIAGLRWYSDVDYPGYVEMYNDNPLLHDFSPNAISSLYGEPGYLFLTAIFKSLDSGFGMLALACATVSMLLKTVVVARMSRHASLALGLYLCLHFITNEFIQLRWALATGWIALAFLFQYRERYAAAIVCFAIAAAFHYFSIVFWLVGLALPFLKGHKRFYVLFAVSLVAALVLKNDQLSHFLISDSELYVLSRVTRYASTEEAPLGVFSFVKLLMYPVIYVGCMRLRPSDYWTTDRLNTFLFKISFVSLSVTLALSFIPILHYRATIIADFFSIILILNALNYAFERRMRTLAFAVLTVLFCTWYALDFANYVRANRLYEYQTWLTAL